MYIKFTWIPRIQRLSPFNELKSEKRYTTSCHKFEFWEDKSELDQSFDAIMRKVIKNNPYLPIWSCILRLPVRPRNRAVAMGVIWGRLILQLSFRVRVGKFSISDAQWASLYILREPFPLNSVLNFSLQ